MRKLTDTLSDDVWVPDDAEHWIAADAALAMLRQWHDSSRVLPGYVYGNGTEYLCLLLGVPNTSGLRLAKSHPHIMANLVGPNGWAYLQIMIARCNKIVNHNEEVA
jgi:hypothetical protein